MSLTQINKAGLDEIALDHVFTIGASGSSAYTFQGEGLNGTVNNPTLYLTRGKTYRFENGSGGHPIRIQSTSGASGTAYNTGVTNNAGSGTVIVEVQHDAPDVLYYQCTSHAAMNGILYITGALADGGVTTAKIADDAVTTDKIADQAVTLAKLPHGTSSNNGKFLRANNGADPSFESLPASGLSNVVEDTSPQLGGDLASNGNNINMADNDEIVIGSSNDLIIRHIPSSRHEILGSASASLQVRCDDQQFLSENGNEYLFKAVKDGGVELYYDNAKKLETKSYGAIWTGQLASLDNSKVTFGNSDDLQIYHDGSNSYIDDVGAGLLYIQGNSSTVLSLRHTGNNNAYLNFKHTGHENNYIGYEDDHFVVYTKNAGAQTHSMRINVDQSGLAFHGDTAAANRLNDYEEGTWTPTIGSGSTTIYESKYTKIGNLVHVHFYALGFSDNSSSNAVSFSGLPFTAASDNVATGNPLIGKISFNSNIVAHIGGSGTTINFFDYGSGDYDHVRHNNINGTDTTHRIFISITYRAA